MKIQTDGSLGEPSCLYESFDAWTADWRDTEQFVSRISWSHADWLVAGQDRWGDAAIAWAESETGWSAGKISDYAKVSRTFPISDRLKSLTFSHHLEVVRLPKNARDRILRKADEDRWTVRQVREAAREASGAAENARLRTRVAELEDLLRRERATQEEAKRGRVILERSVASGCRSITESYKDIAASIEAFLSSPLYAGLHGNERRALVKRLRGRVLRCTERAAELVDQRLDPLLPDDKERES